MHKMRLNEHSWGEGHGMWDGTHLLDRSIVGVGEVGEEPEDTRTNHVADDEEERGDVEEVHEAHRPVDEAEHHRRVVESAQALRHCGIEHALSSQ